MQNLIIINDNTESPDPHYINKLYVLLESLYIFGNINDATNILVPERYTNNIKNSNLYCSKIGLPSSSWNIVCLIANICPGPEVRLHKLPKLSFGLQAA